MQNLRDIAEANLRWLLASRGLFSDPSHYVITHSSYRRFNSSEQEFMTRYYLPTLRGFDCRCAVCGSDSDGIEMDHFYLSKCSGGNFILTLKGNSTRILNAVPLCISCNRHKSATSDFLLEADIRAISSISASLSVSMLGASLPPPGIGAPMRLSPDTGIPLILARSEPGTEGWNLCMHFLETDGCGEEELQKYMDRLVRWDEEVLNEK